MSITPLILTLNEAPNIGRVLERLTWAERVVVVDSGSTDETLEICKRYPNVEVVYRAFDSFAGQCNFGLTLIKSPWCLSIDADYVIPEETSAEMLEAVKNPRADGYYATLTYCVQGHALRRAILPPRIVLFQTLLGRYEQDGHAHRLMLEGGTATLRNTVMHDDRKPLKRWLNSQETYAAQEVAKLTATSWSALRWPDRVRLMGVVAPWLVPAYYLFAKRGILDGWAGFDYAAQRAIAELVFSVQLIEKTRLTERLSSAPGKTPPGPQGAEAALSGKKTQASRKDAVDEPDV